MSRRSRSPNTERLFAGLRAKAAALNDETPAESSSPPDLALDCATISTVHSKRVRDQYLDFAKLQFVHARETRNDEDILYHLRNGMCYSKSAGWVEGYTEMYKWFHNLAAATRKRKMIAEVEEMEKSLQALKKMVGNMGATAGADEHYVKVMADRSVKEIVLRGLNAARAMELDKEVIESEEFGGRLMVDRWVKEGLPASAKGNLSFLMDLLGQELEKKSSR